MNKKLKNFEQQLYALINNSGLSIGELYYILKCALFELESLYNSSVLQESATEQPKLEEDLNEELKEE